MNQFTRNSTRAFTLPRHVVKRANVNSSNASLRVRRLTLARPFVRVKRLFARRITVILISRTGLRQLPFAHFRSGTFPVRVVPGLKLSRTTREGRAAQGSILSRPPGRVELIFPLVHATVRPVAANNVQFCLCVVSNDSMYAVWFIHPFHQRARLRRQVTRSAEVKYATKRVFIRAVARRGLPRVLPLIDGVVPCPRTINRDPNFGCGIKLFLFQYPRLAQRIPRARNGARRFVALFLRRRTRYQAIGATQRTGRGPLLSVFLLRRFLGNLLLRSGDAGGERV